MARLGVKRAGIVTPSEKRLIRAERRAEDLITIHEYDPRWPALFAAERAEIAKALGDAREEDAAAERDAKRSLESETSALAQGLAGKILGREVRS